jgi:hypothetical protein
MLNYWVNSDIFTFQHVIGQYTLCNANELINKDVHYKISFLNWIHWKESDDISEHKTCRYSCSNVTFV